MIGELFGAFAQARHVLQQKTDFGLNQSLLWGPSSERLGWA
jgi:hypothetical protein